MAGSWYPAGGEDLRRDVDGMLERARVKLPSAESLVTRRTEAAALVVPHAGYIYSGLVAARAYASLGDWRPRRVIVVAPSHHECFNSACVWDPGNGGNGEPRWETPLGGIPVDAEFCRRLIDASDSINGGMDGHREEHSLELQIPFLQRQLGDFELVPVAMGAQDSTLIGELGQALSDLRDEVPTLLVASTDLSHFHRLKEAEKLDARVLDYLRAMDHEGLERSLSEGSCEACGGGPASVILRWAKAVMRNPGCRVLDYRTSADKTGDTWNVVGYTAAIVAEGL